MKYHSLCRRTPQKKLAKECTIKDTGIWEFVNATVRRLGNSWDINQ